MSCCLQGTRLPMQSLPTCRSVQHGSENSFHLIRCLPHTFSPSMLCSAVNDMAIRTPLTETSAARSLPSRHARGMSTGGAGRAAPPGTASARSTPWTRSPTRLQRVRERAGMYAYTMEALQAEVEGMGLDILVDASNLGWVGSIPGAVVHTSLRDRCVVTAWHLMPCPLTSLYPPGCSTLRWPWPSNKGRAGCGHQRIQGPHGGQEGR